MSLRIVLAVAICLLAAAPAARAVVDADRTAVYQQFRTSFDAHRYSEALPLAQRLVAMTEEQYGPSGGALVNPLVNLGTTLYRLRDYAAAQDAYTRCLSLLDASAPAADRQFIRPLQGLGATYFALGRYEDSVAALKRAIDISRNIDGLFNPEQLTILRPLIASYDALHRPEESAKEQQYAYTIAQTSFGKDDVRLLPAIDAFARWHESVGRYSEARALHAQAVQLAEKLGGRGSVLIVEGLRGIARTYRLIFLYGEAQPEAQAEFTGSVPASFANSNDGRVPTAHPDGERALRAAVQVLQAQKPLDERRVGETLVDLGDWYQSTGTPNRAANVYRLAWKNLAATGSTALLAAPQPLTYKAPTIATSRHLRDSDDHDTRTVELTLNVDREGEAGAVKISGGDAPEAQAKPVLNAVKRTRFRPRLENGEPVATTGVLFKESVQVKRKN